MRQVFGALLVVGMLVFAAGCQDEGPSSSRGTLSAQADNEICPIMNHRVNPAVATRPFEGRTVGFCCTPCVTTWDGMSDDERREALAKVMPPEAR